MECLTLLGLYISLILFLYAVQVRIRLRPSSNTAFVNSLPYCYEQPVECISQREQRMVKVEGLQKER
jgi:hypothetical protein